MTKDDFMWGACEAKWAADQMCGIGDPYPYDVKAAAYIEAFRALGGSDDEINAAWRATYKRKTG